MKTNFFLQNLNPNNIKNKIIFDKNIMENIEVALKQKNILVSNLLISENNNTKNLVAHTFFCTNKLKHYRNKIQNKKYKTKNLNKKKIVNLLQNTNNLNFKINNLNLLINRKKLIRNFKNYKFFSAKLFNKRINLFGDFLKILTLFREKKASVWLFCFILSTIFKSLQKKKHGLFTSFVNIVFKTLVSEKNSCISGIKFLISGRLKGKPRASFSKMTMGKISLTSNKDNIQHAQLHCNTIYGCFGLKLWINFKS
jgi:hypothetical protein